MVLLLTVGYTVVALYLNGEGFRRELLKKVNGALDGHLDVDRHRIELLSGRLELTGVRLSDTRGELLASASRLRLRIFWPALLWRSIRIKSLNIENARVNLQYDHQDRLQLVKLTRPSDADDEPRKESKPWSLCIDDGRITGGVVHFDRPAKDWSADGEGVEIAAGLDLSAQSGHVRISAGLLLWRQPGADHTLTSLDITAAIDKSRTIILNVKTPQSHLKINGYVDWPAADPQVDLTADLNTDLDALQRLLPEKAALKGRLSARIKARGRWDDPDITLDTTWTQPGALGVNLDRVEAEVRMQHRQVTIAGLRSQAMWGALTLSGRIDLLPVLGPGSNLSDARWDALTYDLQVNAQNLQPARLPLGDLPLHGAMNLKADLAGTGTVGDAARGNAQIDLQASDLSWRRDDTGAIGHLEARLQWDGPAITLSRMQATAGESKLKGSARIDTDAGTIGQAEINFQSDHLESLGPLLGIPIPSGKGRLNLRCQGPWRRPRGNIEILAQDLVMEGRPLGRLVARAQLNGQGQLRISDLALENQGSLVEGGGQLQLLRSEGGLATDPGVDLNLAFQQLEPKDFGLDNGMAGNFHGRIEVKGSLQHLKARAELDQSSLRWHGFDGIVQGNARWNDGRLTVSDLNLLKGASKVHLQGSANWQQPGTHRMLSAPLVQARISGQNVQLQDFFADQRGTVALEGEVSGPLPGLKGRFGVSANELNIGGQPLESLALHGRVEGKKVTLEALDIDIEKGQTVRAEGWFGFNRRFESKVRAADIELSRIKALQQAYPVGGRLDIQLDASGTLDHPRLSADLKVRQPRFKDQPWENFELKAELLEGRLELTAGLNFDLTASYQLANGDFNLQAHFDQSDLSPYLALWAGADWGGVLSGSLQVKGNRHHLERIQGRLALSDAALRFKNNPLVSAPALQARMENGRLEMPSARLTLLQNGFINLSANGRPTDNLEVATDGRMPMAALAPFLTGADDARGQLIFHARAQGPLTQMEWQADLELAAISMEVPGLAQSLEDVNGHLKIDPRKLNIPDVSGLLDGGRFELSGQMQLKDGQPVNGRLEFKARVLPLQWPGTMDVVVNSDLTLKYNAGEPVLQGGLVLLEGSYYKPVRLNLLSAVSRTRRVAPPPADVEMPPRIGKIALNVTVTHRYPLLVDNNLAQLQVAPDLKVTGTLARPIVSGRAQVTEGEVIFRRKSFTVKRGVVDFINPYKTEPNLDIQAETRIRQWLVTLSLSGPPDRLAFKLSSDPPASENDILSLILLGRTSSELAQGEGGSSQTTGQMLASLIATAWGEDVKKRSGVDILEVETGAGEDPNNADRIQVTVGKRLSRRLTIKYEVESGSEELVQRAVSEYRFWEHLLASGFQDSKGAYGGELLFRLEF